MDGAAFILATVAEEEELVTLQVAFSSFNVKCKSSHWAAHDLAPPSIGGVN